MTGEVVPTWLSRLDPAGWRFEPFSPGHDGYCAHHPVLDFGGSALCAEYSGLDLMKGEHGCVVTRAAIKEHRRRQGAGLPIDRALTVPHTHEASPEPCAMPDAASRLAALETENAGLRDALREAVARLTAPSPARAPTRSWWRDYATDPRLGAHPYLPSED